MNKKLLSVQDAAKWLGISIKTLHRWEKKGYLIGERTFGNHRRYSLEQLKELKGDKCFKRKLPEWVDKGGRGEKGDILNRAMPVGRKAWDDNRIGFLNLFHSLDKTRKGIIFGFSSLFVVTLCTVFIYNVLLPQISFFLEETSEDPVSSSLTQTEGKVLAETTMKPNKYIFDVNIPATFHEEVEFLKDVKVGGRTVLTAGTEGQDIDLNLGTGNITAPNVLYSLTAGSGVSVTTGQNPTISNSGVLSLGGSTGALSLTAGSGISISGLTITNSSPGTDQKIFKTIKIGGDSFSASSNTDTLEFVAGSNISLSPDTSNKKITIATSAITAAAGWTDDGTVVRLTTSTDFVGIGTSLPSQLFQVNANNSNPVVITSNGNVGIGVTSPASALQVLGNILPSSSSSYNLGSSSLYWNNIYANNIIGTGTVQGFWQRNTGSIAPTNISDSLNLGAIASTSALVHFTGTSGGDSWINTGNLGIGITSPAYKLDISPGSGNALNIAALSNDGQKGINLTVSADTDGDYVYGIYTNTNVGSGTLSSDHRYAYAMYNNLTAGSDTSADWSYYPELMGIYNNINATSNAVQEQDIYVMMNETPNYTGDNTLLDGVFNKFRLGGSGTVGYSHDTYFYLKKDDGISQTAYGVSTGFLEAGSGDIAYGNWIMDVSNSNITGGTVYGDYINLRNSNWTNAWSIYVEPTSAKSYFGSNVGIGHSNPGGKLVVMGGNVGIGVTSPGSALQVAGNIAPSQTGTYDLGSSSLVWNNIYANNIIGTGTVQGFWQRNTGSIAPTNISDSLNLGAIASTSALVHFTGTSGGDSWINTGNLGIGITSPAYKLDISPGSGNALNIAALSNNGQKGINLTTSPTADGTTVYGIYNTGNVGSSILSSGNRYSYSVYNNLSNASDSDSELNYIPGVYGVYNSIDISGNASTYKELYGMFNLMTSYSGDYSTFGGGYNTFYVGGDETWADGFANAVYLAPSDGKNQTFMGFDNWVYSSGPGDIYYGYRIEDVPQFGTFNGGTAYGSYFDLSSSGWTNAWSIYVEPTSAKSYFGSNVGIGHSNPGGKLVVMGGNVGIGVSSPSSVLQIAGDITPNATGTRNIGSSSLYWNNIYANNIIGASSGAQGYLQRNSGSLTPYNISDSLNLGAIASTSALVHLAGTSGGDSWVTTGNVGIGTSSPLTKLDIAGDASASGSLVLRGTSRSTLDILNGSAFDIQTSNGGDSSLIPRLTVLSNGNIGIGTTNPSSFLMQLAGNLGPDSNNSYDLGSSAKQWGTIYTQNLNVENLTAPNLTGNMTIGETLDSSEGFEDVSFPPASWTTGGDASWTRTTSVYQAGTASAVSGTITNNQTSWIKYTKTFANDGTIKFYWKMSSRSGYDYLLFCIDDDTCDQTWTYKKFASGTNDWAEVTAYVSAGEHTFKWIYAKYWAGVEGSDQAWIDNIRFYEGGHLFANSYIGVGNTDPQYPLDVTGDARISGRIAMGNDAQIGVPPVDGVYDRIFDLSHTITDFSSSTYWEPFRSVINLNPSVDLTGNNLKYIYGFNMEIEVPSGNSQNIDNITGFYLGTFHSGTGLINNLVGQALIAENIEGGDVLAQEGAYIVSDVGTTSSTTMNYGIYLETGHRGSGGSITDDFSLYINTPRHTRTITNHFGLYLDDQSYGTNNWSIYSVKGKNLFGGNTYIADPSDVDSEKVTNGSFTGSAAGWNLGSGWTYGSNKVTKNADGTETLSQDISAVANEIYVLTYTISSRTAGYVAPTLGGKQGITRRYNGTYTETIIAENTGSLIFTPSNTARLSIDDVSVKKITGGDLYALGNVGIGTVTPLAALDISGSATMSGTLTLSTIKPPTGALNLMYKQGQDSWNYGLTLLDNSGNVGIGNSSPLQALEVNGRIRMNTWTADGDTAVYKNSSGDIGLQSSDLRLKTNITSVQNSLEIIDKINPVTFNWKTDPNNPKKVMGVIAQDLLPVIPEATFSFTGANGENYYGVHYEKLSVLALQGIKEQQLKIASVSSQLAQAMSQMSLSQMGLTEGEESTTGSTGSNEGAVASLQLQLNQQKKTIDSLTAKLDLSNDKIASISSALEKIEQIELLKFLTYSATQSSEMTAIQGGLIVAGPSSFSEVSVKSLSINNNLSISENSINTLGSDLSIQPLRQGNVSIMGDLVKIDTEGNVIVEGNATFAKDVEVKGVLSAKDVNTEEIKLKKDKFLDISETESISSASAGTSFITGGETIRKIRNPFVKSDSLIYVTGVGKLEGQTPYLLEQKEGEYFIVEIGHIVERNIKFNFLIVN